MSGSGCDLLIYCYCRFLFVLLSARARFAACDVQSMVIDGCFLRHITEKLNFLIKNAWLYQQNITQQFRRIAADECFQMQ